VNDDSIAPATTPDYDQRVAASRVQVAEEVVLAVDAAVGIDTSVEQGGVLVGTYDPESERTWVTGSIVAVGAVSEAASLRFTHETWDHVNTVMEQDFPGQRMVGWYHSHPHFGIFLSDYDQFIHENFFREPWQVAYVVDPLLEQRGWFGWVDGALVRFPAWQTFRTERGEGGDRPVGSPPANRPDPVLKVESLDLEPPTKGMGTSSLVLLLLLGIIAGGVLATFLFRDDGSAAAAATFEADEQEDVRSVVPGEASPLISGRVQTDLDPSDVQVSGWVSSPNDVVDAEVDAVVDGGRVSVEVVVAEDGLPEEEVPATLHLAVTGCADTRCEGDQVTEVTTHPFTVTTADDGLSIPGFGDLGGLSAVGEWIAGLVGPTAEDQLLLLNPSPTDDDAQALAAIVAEHEVEVAVPLPEVGLYVLRGDLAPEDAPQGWRVLEHRGYDLDSRVSAIEASSLGPIEIEPEDRVVVAGGAEGAGRALCEPLRCIPLDVPPVDSEPTTSILVVLAAAADLAEDEEADAVVVLAPRGADAATTCSATTAEGALVTAFETAYAADDGPSWTIVVPGCESPESG
jgi:proteasome lid subunit RPN8/RPN11